MKYRGIGEERKFLHLTKDKKIPVWDSSTEPWTKVYITVDEYTRLSKEIDGETMEVPE